MGSKYKRSAVNGLRLVKTSFSLAASGIFAAIFLVSSLTLAADNVARREQVQNLLPSDQQRLLRNQERFSALPPAEQERLRTLHFALTSAPDAASLRTTLERYHEWLKTLSPEQRAELVELPADARIERIGKLIVQQKEDQKRRRPRSPADGPPLPYEDMRALAQWFEHLVWEHRDELLAPLPAARRQQIEKLDEPARKRALIWVAIQRWKFEPLPIDPEDIDRLEQQLSPGSRDRLSEPKNIGQKRKQVRDWLHQALATRMESFAMRRGFLSVSGEDLERFFQNDLPKGERDRLLNLPRDQMQQELRQLYIQHTGRPDPPPGGHPDFPPFGPRGGRPERRERPEFPDGPSPPEHRLDRPDRPDGSRFSSAATPV